MKTYKTERQKLVEQYQNLKTNDELLAAQALYYKQKKQHQPKQKQPDNKNNNDNNNNTSTKKSKFKQKMDSKPMEQGNQPTSSQSQSQRPKFQESTLMIGNILEKNTSHLNQNKNTSFNITEKGFPSVFKHNDQEIATNVKFHQNDSMWHHQQFFNINNESSIPPKPPKKQKLSLFAQRMQSNKTHKPHNSDHQQINPNDRNQQKHDSMFNALASAMPNDPNTAEHKDNISFIHKLNIKSNIVPNDDIHKIGAENSKFLQQHNESEILEMRQQLLSSLDPKLIALLTTNSHSTNDKDKPVNAKKKKIKISYESKTATPTPTAAVIRQSKPLKPTKITPTATCTVPATQNNNTLSDTEWMHPAQEISASIDSATDRNKNIPGPSQKEKMEWMEPLNVSAEQSKYHKADTLPMMLGDNPLIYFRFGFDGKVLCDNKGIIQTEEKTKFEENIIVSGLHHHGEEPLKPGYTVNELIHLSKSTVANQRNTALKALMCIIQRMRCGEYGMDYSEYLWVLLQEKKFIHLVIDILSMEKNISCIIPILELLYAVVVPMRVLFDGMNDRKVFYNGCTDKLIFDGYHILCGTLPNIAPVEMCTNQSLFKYKYDADCSERKQYETGSFVERKQELSSKNDMNDVWQCDVILAMLRKTKIIKYFNNILMKYVLCGDNVMYVNNILPSLLDIVMSFVMHHPEIVEMVLTAHGFMDSLLELVFKAGIDWIYKCKVIDIICIMCEMNKKTIAYLVEHNKLNDFKAFIVEGIDFNDNSGKLQLSISALALWRVCIKFGYDFDAFNDLFAKLIQIFSDFTMKFEKDEQKSNDKIFELRQRQTRAVLNIIDVLLQNLTPTNLRHLPSVTNVSWNQIAKLTEKCIEIFDKTRSLDGNIMKECDYLCIGGLAHIISTYFNTLRQQNDSTTGQSYDDLFQFAKKQSMILCKKYIATWSVAKENKLLHSILLNKRNWTYNNTESEKNEHNKLLIQFPFLDGLLCDIPLSIAVVPTAEYLSKCDYLLGIIKMVTEFIKTDSKIISILIQSRFIDAIGRILLQITNKHFHFRLNRSLRSLLFNYWRIEFLLAYHILSLCNLCQSGGDSNTLKIINIHSAACVLLECIPPGYQHLAHKLLHQYILSRNYLPALKKLAVKNVRKNPQNNALLNGKSTAFYIESDIDKCFYDELINIYTKHDLYLPSVFNKKMHNLCDANHSFYNVSRIKSLCCVPTMVPTFWLLQPMINLYKHNIGPQSITTLLHFFFILSKCYSDDFMEEIITFNDDEEDEDGASHHYWCNIGVWDTYRTIGTLYLCDSNIYSDELNYLLIYELMKQCWNRIFCAQYEKHKNEIYLCDKNDPSSACIVDNEINEINGGSANFNIKSLGREWQGFYTKLVEQFQSDSFGDDLFAKIILFQQQNNYHKRFKTIIWTQIDSLGILLKNNYPPNIYYQWKSFFVPFECDKTIIHCQLEAVAKNKTNLPNLAECSNSFLYFVAIVQLSHYIWSNDTEKINKNIKRNMLNNILNQCEKCVIIDIVNCKFNHIHSLVIKEDETNNFVKQLKEFINIGKNKIVITDDNEYKISILKNDFASVCKKLSLF